MDFAELIPVVAIMATAWVIVTVMRARRGSPAPEKMTTGEARENVQLARENERLRLNVERLEQRMAVLERIATDPAERTAREIESLR